ncbi:MAG: Fpg/Nei family DNA glycosylase [Acidimicrobiales bacterium]
MPELPEVEALVQFLRPRVDGAEVERVELAALSALKTFDPPLVALAGATLAGCERRGKFLCLRSDGPWLVLHLARGGWVQWRDEVPAARAKVGKGPLALRLGLRRGSGFDVTEAGTEKRLAIWVVDRPERVEAVARLGPDALSAGFDADALADALAGQTSTLKRVLTDQSVIAGIGNAYSDEALHRARLSPFKPAANLRPDEILRLHAALTGVLGDALDRSAGLPAKGLKGEKKAGLGVHGRTGLPCGVCGDTVREVAFSTRSLQYCPTCQTGGKPLADRRMSRLLK